MTFEPRPITDDEVPTFRTALSLGFGDGASPEGDERFRALMPLERTLAVLDGDHIVGTLGDFDLRLTVPGGAQLSMAGTTMVTVRSTHRRRGVLRAMIERHLATAIERGDPVAGLWASETGIYGRFGWGLATELHSVTVDGRHVQLPEPAIGLTIELIAPEDIPELVAPLWSQLARTRPGFIDRSAERWNDIASDPAFNREGTTRLRPVVVRRNGHVVGYVGYRQNSRWTDGIPEGTVKVTELVAADHDAQRALWHYITHIDLFPRVEYGNGQVDDPILYDASDMRAFRRVVGDSLYLRILDLETALQTRTYEVDDELVLRVNDPLGHAEGTCRLRVTGGVGRVSATDDDPDVELEIRELGSIYLGGSSAVALAAAGRISGSPAAIERLGRLFRSSVAPWCSEDF